MDGRKDKSHAYTPQPSSRQKRKKDSVEQTPQVAVKKKAQSKDESPMEGVRRHFYFIKEDVSSRWKDLAFHLGFGKAADIDNISSKSRDDRSCCMNLLQEWLTRNGDKATIEALMEALSEANLQSTLDGLKKRTETAAQSQLRTANIQPPDGLQVVETENDRIKLRWDPVDSDQLFGYRVEKSIPNPEAFQLIWESTHDDSVPVLPVQPTEFEVPRLKPYHAYNFRVKSAIYIEGNLLFGEGSLPQYVTTRKQYQPFRPRCIMVSTGNTQGSVSLRWTQPIPAPDVNPASYEYVIEMCCHVGGTCRHTWTECCRTKQQTCTVKMEHSGDYYFRVSAINTKEAISSLPQEMENPGMPVHIECQSGWLQLSMLQLSSLNARWLFSSTKPTSKAAGSIVYVISCLDLDGLRELWMNYNLGKVKTFFQDLFGLDHSNASDTELDIKIDEQAFYACRQHLLLTCPVDGGRRVVRLGESLSRGTKWGLSEDYPVYCKPISHKTTCSQLDFLDLAISTRQPTAGEKGKMQPKQFSAEEGLVRLAAVKPVPDLPVHLHLNLEQHPTASEQTTDVKVLEQILELERTQFTADILRSPGHHKRMRDLFLSHKAFMKVALAHGPAILLLTFLCQTDVDRFYHNHYRVGEGTLSQQLSRILISSDLQDKVRDAQLIVGLQVKHEDYVQVRDRLGQGLDRTMSVDNLMALKPPTKHVGSSNLRGLDLAMVSRQDQSCKGMTDDASTLNFTVRQVQTALQLSRVKLKEQLKGLYQTARQDSEARIRSLSKEVTVLTQKDEKAQKILLEHKEEIRQLQETNKTDKAKIGELESENTKLSNQLPSLHDEVRSLREKDETSQKVLLEKNLEIQHLQDTNKDMATKIQDLMSAKHELEGRSEGESSVKGKDSRKSREGQSGSKDTRPGASLKESWGNAAVLLVNDSYGTSETEIPINRHVIEALRRYGPDIPVYSTVLRATEEDKQDAQPDNVTLLLPMHDPDDPRTPIPDWLTFDHPSKYPHLPSNVGSIVGHTGVTSRAAVRIKQERCPFAKVILFSSDIPDLEDTEYYKGEEMAMGIWEKEDSILEDAQEADVIFSLGNKIFDHFEIQFRAIPASKRPLHVKFVPRPSKIFVHAKAEYKDTETMVVLSIGRVKGVEKLKGYDLSAESLSIVAEKMKVKWRAMGVSKYDDTETRKAIRKHCKSANLQITFLPYGTQKDICKEMMQAHLVLMPSRAEPFGLVGLEAIAAGVPVLVSSRSGLADFIHEHVDELHHSIVDMDGSDEHATVKHLANTIERMLKHNRTEFKTAARGKQQLLSTKYWEESHLQLIKVCMDKVVRKYFFYIKEKVSSDWKDLAFHLGFEKPEVDSIAGRNRDDNSRCMDLLEEWLKRNGEKATIEVLMEALSKANLQSVVDGLKKEIVERNPQIKECISNYILELEGKLKQLTC